MKLLSEKIFIENMNICVKKLMANGTNRPIWRMQLKTLYRSDFKYFIYKYFLLLLPL